MFPLSSLMKTFVQKGSLTVIDVDDKRHVFSGSPGLEVTMKLHDKASVSYTHLTLPTKA